MQIQLTPMEICPTWITSLIMFILTFLIAGFFLHGIERRFIWVLVGFAITAIHISPTIE